MLKIEWRLLKLRKNGNCEIRQTMQQLLNCGMMAAVWSAQDLTIANDIIGTGRARHESENLVFRHSL